MTPLQTLLGVELPIIQAPMAGVQGSALAIAVSNAGGLGSLPCAMLGVDAIRTEVAAIKAQSSKPFNVNFFCHSPPAPSAEREAAWRAALFPYYREFGLAIDNISVGPGRMPFSSEAADALSEFKPAVVSFHFGLPSPELLARGILRLYRLRLKNNTAAVLYSLFANSTVFCYLQGYDPEFAALSPGTYLMFAVMEDAVRSRVKKFDLLRGEESYKQHWRAQIEATSRIQLSNTSETAILSNVWRCNAARPRPAYLHANPEALLL